jgi:hypothetical protein
VEKHKNPSEGASGANRHYKYEDDLSESYYLFCQLKKNRFCFDISMTVQISRAVLGGRAYKVAGPDDLGPDTR